MQNILVPTDFSNNAFHALRYATGLFKNKSCTFFLLNVYGGAKGFKKNSIHTGREIPDEVKDAAIARLNNTVRKIRKENTNPEHSYQVISRPGDLVPAMNALIDELKIDLIVLGNKGKRSSIPVFLGSNTTKTLESVKKCPILTVPKGAQLMIPMEIGFATDFKKPFDFTILDPLRSMALLSGAAIRIIHMDEKEKLDTSQKKNLDSLLAYLSPLSNSVERIPKFISKTTILQLFLANSELDMLYMVNNEHGVLEKMLREPVIEKMVLKIDIPFMVISESAPQP